MFYAEGKWDYHLDDFATLPERSILFHVDQGDIFLAHRKLHQKFALSGGIPNVLLSYGKPDEVRAYCRKSRGMSASCAACGKTSNRSGTPTSGNCC
jgi:hypothetical protein